MVVADVRRGEWGTTFESEVVRDFLHSALRHPAAADMVSEYIFDLATGDDGPPGDVGEALRVALGEVLSAATVDDWKQVAGDLLAAARECIDDDASAVSPPERPMPDRRWSLTPPQAAKRRRRKPLVRVEQSEILAWLTEVGSATTTEIAQHFDIDSTTVWRKADGLARQGKLDVQPGTRVCPRVYSVPRPTEPTADGLSAERQVAREDRPQHRLALPTRSS